MTNIGEVVQVVHVEPLALRQDQEPLVPTVEPAETSKRSLVSASSTTDEAR